MFNQFHLMSGRPSFKLNEILLLIAILLACFFPVTSEASEAMCKDLNKISNLDELLYQWHANLDSDCLFVMPVAELENAWGIKILSDELGVKSGKTDYELWVSSDFYNKPYKSEVDAFFVEKRLKQTHSEAKPYPEGNNINSR